jgi:hypothetical protein
MPFKRSSSGDTGKTSNRQKSYYKLWYERHKSHHYVLTQSRKKKLRLDFKSGLKCDICGESHLACLDFHHKDPADKQFSISSAIHQGVSAKVVMEIAKCRVLCANCHRKLHYENPELVTGRRRVATLPLLDLLVVPQAAFLVSDSDILTG